MIEMLIGGFLLTGTVCAVEGEGFRNCRDIPKIQFGNKYVCDRRIETIINSIGDVAPERLGFAQGEHLKVRVQCSPANMAGI